MHDDLLQFDSHYFERNGLKMHYLDEGQGAPVIMVHGNPTWCFYYRNLVEALRPACRCIVPDHIGCGLSDKPGDNRYRYTLGQRVDDLEALLDSLHLGDNLTLVLHDWGGMIGMAFAARHPERIKRIVLFNTAAFHLPASKPFPWPLWLTRTPLGALLVRGGNAFSLTASFVCCRRKPMPRALRHAYRAPYDSWANRIATLRFVQDIPLRPKDPAYPVVSETQAKLALFRETPVLICWGLKDFVFSHHFLAEWEKHWPQAEVHRFPDCGHYILEDAFEEIAPRVKTFLISHPLDTAQ